MFHWALKSSFNPSPWTNLLKQACIYKEGKSRHRTNKLFVSLICPFVCPQSASNHLLLCVNKCARLVYWAGSKYLARRRGGEEREGGGIMLMCPNTTTRSKFRDEKRDRKNDKTKRGRREEDGQSERRQRFNRTVGNKRGSVGRWEEKWVLGVCCVQRAERRRTEGDTEAEEDEGGEREIDKQRRREWGPNLSSPAFGSAELPQSQSLPDWLRRQKAVD